MSGQMDERVYRWTNGWMDNLYFCGLRFEFNVPQGPCQFYLSGVPSLWRQDAQWGESEAGSESV